jgi:hypothetical protein
LPGILTDPATRKEEAMPPEKEDDRKKFWVYLTAEGWDKPNPVEVRAHHFKPPTATDQHFRFYKAADKEDEDILFNAKYVVCVVPV